MIEFGPAGHMQPMTFGLPNRERVAKAMEGMVKLVEVAAQIRQGHFDRVISMTTESGPVALGFLDLTMELYARDAVLDPIRGAFTARWAVAPVGVTIHIVGDTQVGDSQHVVIPLSATIRPGQLSPGTVNFAEVATPEPVRYRTRRGKIRSRVSSYGVRLRVMEVARPVGTVPHRNGAAFVPLSF